MKGWKREIVHRNILTNSNQQSDVYYKTPDGKKMRSIPMIAQYCECLDNLIKKEFLKINLNIFNFFINQFLIDFILNDFNFNSKKQP